MTTIFGIKNCDTVKKARKWLSTHHVDHEFVDFRDTPLPAATIEHWLNLVGKDILLNTRSTTWRNLPDEDKGDLTLPRTIHLLQAHPTLIKRPILVHNNSLHVGFNEAEYQELFA